MLGVGAAGGIGVCVLGCVCRGGDKLHITQDACSTQSDLGGFS